MHEEAGRPRKKRGPTLRGTLFLTRPQLDAARGDVATRLPAELSRPTHWRV